MKRRLIKFDEFERSEKDSLSANVVELQEASDILASVLECDGNLELRFFDPEVVTYETQDGTFVRAAYVMKEGAIEFSNIEELVIDEDSQQSKAKTLLNEMVDAVLEEKNHEAENLFSEFMALPNVRQTLIEGTVRTTVTRGTSGRKGPNAGKKIGSTAAKKSWITRRRHQKQFPGLFRKGQLQKKAKRNKLSKTKYGKRNERRLTTRIIESNLRKLSAMRRLTENVFGYIDYKHYGPLVESSHIQFDEKANATTISIPSKEIRLKHQLEKFKWDVLSVDNVVHRMAASKLSENNAFAKAVAELRKFNALSDNTALEETLENIVSRWPGVLYLTQDELAKKIAECLEAVGATNYDDNMCNFMAEGILRVAHNAYVDKVNKIYKWAGVEPIKEAEDAYLDFKEMAEKFYPSVDESAKAEMQVYVDLYEAFRDLRTWAVQERNDELKSDSEHFLTELLQVVTQQVAPNTELAAAAAEYLSDLIETNLDSEEWNVSNAVHTTVSGDHPAMAEKAKKEYTPSKDFSGDWGDTAPVSDGKNYKGNLADQMRSSAWGNLGGEDTYPTLKNPYIPEPFGDYKIKGEKTIEDDSDLLGHVSNKDTWPELQNPYVPDSVTPQSYKMNHGKEKDLVVDK